MPKFLISIDFFFVKNIILNIFGLIYYYNIRLPYRIRKVVGNISINIYSKSWGEKIMWWRWACKDYMRWIEVWGRMGGTLWSKKSHDRVGIWRVEKHGMFWEPNNCIWLCPLSCSLFYSEIILSSVDMGMVGRTTFKPRVSFVLIILSLYSWLTMFTWKLPPS